MRRVVLVLGLVGIASAVLLLVSAGGHNEEGSPGTVIQLTARDIRFVPDEIRVPAGQKLTLRLKNRDNMEHDLEVQGLRVQVSGDAHGAGGHHDSDPGTLALHTTKKKKTASITFIADQKGTYDVWCTLPGHKELGMVAKLVVF